MVEELKRRLSMNEGVKIIKTTVPFDIKSNASMAEKKDEESYAQTYATRALKRSATLFKVEPYVGFLFRHWEKIVKANPSFDGRAVQDLLWQEWVSLNAEELENRQRFQVDRKVRKRKRESEGWRVAAGLVSVTEAEGVTKQLLEELLDRVCRKKQTVNMAEAASGEMKEA